MTEPTGHLEVIIGPMFAGKTTEMLRRVRRHKVAQKKCLVVKYELDRRFSDTSVCTHDHLTVIAEPVSRLIDLASELVDQVDVIGIDEGQFYPDLLSEVRGFLKRGKIVIVSALDGTFDQKPFGDVLSLIPMADAATKLNAVCALCYNEAPFTQRLTSETKVEVIGGSEMYRPVCRACYTVCTKAMARGKAVTRLKRETSCDYGYGEIPKAGDIPPVTGGSSTTTKSPDSDSSVSLASLKSLKRTRDDDAISPAKISFDLDKA